MMAETHTKSDVSTTSTTTSPTYAAPQKSSGISLCLQYFKTGPGIVKLVELFLGILCMACAAPAWTKGTHWFLFVVVTAFVSTSIWCFVYLLNLRNAINLPIDWLLTELFNTAITTLLYLIAVIVQFCSIELATQRNIAAGVFGVFNMLTYAIGSFYLYRDWKDSHPHSSFSGSVLKGNP
ncbi:CKLF-like MARVEL transmembrane domain-containing protein 4 isoform X2 [Homarus americanus]|uniref:CKLF-like MARVEL transmembrane domain-containing protein 4 isoform X2 n=1 Tax=Homarus americanus TaxID=6706 RepID=UPI001C4793E4|nr:CKLF-like MARVEL transmembrane domain-containing protein 4 isoform X2 [Homarus americanus]